jgi:hypothetical protein
MKRPVSDARRLRVILELGEEVRAEGSEREDVLTPCASIIIRNTARNWAADS